MNKSIDITNVILKTECILLRPWQQDDLDDFYEYASVNGVGQMAGWLPHENKEVSKSILDNFIGGKKTFALVYQEKVIGSLGIDEYDEKKFPEFNELACREIGYVLSKDYWGRGLMQEAVKETIKWLFESEKLDLILCGHFTSNRQSARVQEKCGFRFYRTGKYETRFGTVEDAVINILRREDWVCIVRITKDSFNESSLDNFIRTQKVTKVYRMVNSEYSLMYQPFTDDWTSERKREKARELLSGGLIAFGAFIDSELAGFIALESKLNRERMIIDTLHVSAPFRGRGIGRQLFLCGVETARRNGTKTLYISACSSEETIAFYQAMGATVTDDPINELAVEEPFDLQMTRRV